MNFLIQFLLDTKTSDLTVQLQQKNIPIKIPCSINSLFNKLFPFLFNHFLIADMKALPIQLTSWRFQITSPFLSVKLFSPPSQQQWLQLDSDAFIHHLGSFSQCPNFPSSKNSKKLHWRIYLKMSLLHCRYQCHKRNKRRWKIKINLQLRRLIDSLYFSSCSLHRAKSLWEIVSLQRGAESPTSMTLLIPVSCGQVS